MKMTESNPGALANLVTHLTALEKVDGKVGWFESAKYPDGTPVAGTMAVQELGSPKMSIPPRPYFRSTSAEQAAAWKAISGQLANRVLAGEITAEQAMDLLTQQAENDVLRKIESITAPKLSDLTLAARKYRKEGKKVTGATLGELSRKLRDKQIDLSGVSTKPLDETGRAIATLTHIVESKA